MITSIIVGPFTYTVNRDQAALDREAHSSARAIDGFVQRSRLEIVVSPDLAADYEREVVLHEVLHTVFGLVGLDDEEDPVRRIAPVLLDVLQRNPDLVRYLTDDPLD